MNVRPAAEMVRFQYHSRYRGVRGGGRKYQNGGPPFANLSPRLSLFSDHLRTVLAVKGSLRRAQQPRPLAGSGPVLTTLLRRGKGSLRTALLVGDHFAAILVPFFAATDKWPPACNKAFPHRDAHHAGEQLDRKS